MKPLFHIICITLLVLGCIACNSTNSSNPPFWNEIQNFKKKDKENFPPSGGVLFVGSSSFRKWTNLETVFKSYQAINRGFGGSDLLDASYYADDIIFPYKPRQIVIYSGDNDIATDTVDAQEILFRFEALFSKIRTRLPNVPIAYVSIKPSPLREKYLPIVHESNLLIKDFLNTQANAEFINVFSLMLNAGGKPKAELFLEDNLHMNAKGYVLWEKAIRPYLKK